MSLKLGKDLLLSIQVTALSFSNNVCSFRGYNTCSTLALVTGGVSISFLPKASDVLSSDHVIVSVADDVVLDAHTTLALATAGVFTPSFLAAEDVLSSAGATVYSLNVPSSRGLKFSLQGRTAKNAKNNGICAISEHSGPVKSSQIICVMEIMKHLQIAFSLEVLY